MSLTYKSVIVWLVYQLLKWAGFSLPVEGAVESALDLVINVGLALLTLYGRYRAGGLNILGGRVAKFE